MILHRGYRDDPELQHTSVVFSQRRLHRLQTSRISLHVTGTYAAVTVLFDPNPTERLFPFLLFQAVARQIQSPRHCWTRF